MMTNNYALQGQAYTNKAGSVPWRMMGSASDICSLQMVRPLFVNCVQLELTRTLGNQVNCSAIVWQEHCCQGLPQAFVASDWMWHSTQQDNTEPFKTFISERYAL